MLCSNEQQPTPRFSQFRFGLAQDSMPPMIEPPVLVQYKTALGSPSTTHPVSITYNAGDTVLVFAADGNGRIGTVTDNASGGSSVFSVINPGPGTFWQLAYCLSAKAATTVTVTSTGVPEDVSVIVAVFRGVSGIGANTGFLTGSGSIISASQAIAAGSKLVGMLGVAFNAGGSVTLSGDVSSKTTHGDLRTTIGDGNVAPIVALIDSDGSLSAGTTQNLQLTASLSGNWQGIAIELQGQAPSYPLYADLFVIGDIIDSDGLIHASAAVTGNGLELTGQKGSFPCIPQNGGAPVTQTYAMGHVSTRFSFTYGTVEASIRFSGVGVHAVLWMLGVPSRPWANAGSGPWSNPPDGEIDIAEIIDNDLTSIRSSYANPTFENTDTAVAFDVSQGFHDYKLVWTPTSLSWYIDGTQVKTASTSIPNYPMYVLVGGYMGEAGYPITDALLPTTMTVASLKITDANGQPVSNSGNANVIPAYSKGELLLLGVGT